MAQAREADRVAASLVDAGFPATACHTGMGADARLAAQDAFSRGVARAVVLTPACLAEIGRRDTRHVVHYNLPRSLEEYAHETAAAGRDGERAWSDALLCATDVHLLEGLARCGTPSEACVRAVPRGTQTA